MNEWIKVVTHPLGLVGFVLFLVFGLLAKVKQQSERRWLFGAAIVLALISLVGGLGLAYLQTKNSQSAGSAPSQQQTNKGAQQTSSGAGSPNIQGIQGNVKINSNVPQQTESAQTPPLVTPPQPSSSAVQTSSGPGSPNVQGVKGDVVITVDQSSTNTERQKPTESKSKKAERK